MRGMIGRKIFRLVQDTNPNAIIGTHPFPLMAIMKYKERGVIDAPILSVITDYTAHPAYMQKNIDAYITGDSDVSYVLKNSGIPGEKIYSYGIPISKDFLDTRSINAVREQLALEDKFTVLLMGGSFGAGNIKANLVELINSSYDFQIVVVTGRDHALKDKLEKLVKELNTQKSVHILGYTEDMPELLSIGNVLVTKPGGLTTTEAIIKGIPMVIPYYIPGQEQENVDFLLNNGLAIKTSKNYPLSTIIEMLMDSPWRMEEIAERMTRRRKTDSARKVAELAVDLIEKSESKARKPGY
jgi:processive 1,2-diacylglycerol beta-glucosyltransferase